jgi:hypothetical protein
MREHRTRLTCSGRRAEANALRFGPPSLGLGRLVITDGRTR